MANWTEVIAEVEAAWDEAWFLQSITCRFQPTVNVIVGWLQHDPNNVPLVVEAVEAGIPNFVRRIKAQPGHEVHSTTVTRAIHYISAVVRNKVEAISHSDIIKVVNHA